MNKLIQTAEAIIYKDGRKIIKDRVKKAYRLGAIDDRLRKDRTSLESRILEKCSRIGVAVPRVLSVKDNIIEMDYIEGGRVKDILSKKNYNEICKRAGRAVAKLHNNDIVHGDLTTSNMILSGDLYLIDFGLAFHSTRVEDKAVDLHLFYQALQSAHFLLLSRAWPVFLSAYKKHYPASKDVLKRLEDIEKRGRYRERPKGRQ